MAKAVAMEAEARAVSPRRPTKASEDIVMSSWRNVEIIIGHAMLPERERQGDREGERTIGERAGHKHHKQCEAILRHAMLPATHRETGGRGEGGRGARMGPRQMPGALYPFTSALASCYAPWATLRAMG